MFCLLICLHQLFLIDLILELIVLCFHDKSNRSTFSRWIKYSTLVLEVHCNLKCTLNFVQSNKVWNHSFKYKLRCKRHLKILWNQDVNKHIWFFLTVNGITAVESLCIALAHIQIWNTHVPTQTQTQKFKRFASKTIFSVVLQVFIIFFSTIT